MRTKKLVNFQMLSFKFALFTNTTDNFHPLIKYVIRIRMDVTINKHVSILWFLVNILVRSAISGSGPWLWGFRQIRPK